MKIGNRDFDVLNETYIMGILNVTPDSFSDGGKWNNLDAALAHVEQMLEEGADIIDVGGESTRPGHIQISEKEEADRVTPFIREIRKRFDVPISIDTYKASVAEAALDAGADMINDIWGFQYDEKMAPLAARYQASCCLMHNKNEAVYENFYEDILAETQHCIDTALAAGLAKEKICIDPGVGFGKTYEMNLETIHYLERFHSLGYPILLGTSRKSVIGLTLDLPADQRVEGTLVTTVMAVEKKCAFVRVHDIKENKRVIDMTKAILLHKKRVY